MVRRHLPAVGRRRLLRRGLAPRRRNCPPAVRRGRPAISPFVVFRAASRRLKTCDRPRTPLSFADRMSFGEGGTLHAYLRLVRFFAANSAQASAAVSAYRA